jgi:hypothetical protein
MEGPTSPLRPKGVPRRGLRGAVSVAVRLICAALMILGSLMVGRGAMLVLQSALIPGLFQQALRAGGLVVAVGAAMAWLGWWTLNRLIEWEAAR